MQLHLVIIILSILVVGCTSRQNLPEKANQNWKSALKEEQNWIAKGKLVVLKPKKQPSVNFNWQQQDSDLQLNLTNFLGVRVLLLKSNQQGALLEYKNDTYQDRDADSLLNKLTGLTLPINASQLWLRGLVEPEQEAILDELSRTQQTTFYDQEQRAWQIQYNNYALHQGYWLPGGISITSGEFKMKLKINQWSFKK